MFFEEDSIGQTLLGTLFMSGFYWLANKNGRAEAYSEIMEVSRDTEIQNLKKRLDELTSKS